MRVGVEICLVATFSDDPDIPLAKYRKLCYGGRLGFPNLHSISFPQARISTEMQEYRLYWLLAFSVNVDVFMMFWILYQLIVVLYIRMH